MCVERGTGAEGERGGVAVPGCILCMCIISPVQQQMQSVINHLASPTLMSGLSLQAPLLGPSAQPCLEANLD